MPSSALHQKMTAEFLEKIKEWPEDALRILKDAIEQRLNPRSGKKPRRVKGGTMDAFGAWVGPESPEEIIAMIEGARTMGAERESMD